MRDIDVRRAVRFWLDDLHAGDDDTRVVEEMGIWAGSVRIDVAVINGEFHGFELKSAKDTLERLPSQAALYSEVFDRVTLVAAEKHVSKARAIIPRWWGISTAKDYHGEVRLRQSRLAKQNPRPQPLQIARLLWRPEALALLARRGLDLGIRSKPAEALAQKLAISLPLEELRAEVRLALKARTNWRLG
jgi:hypothetical protein